MVPGEVPGIMVPVRSFNKLKVPVPFSVPTLLKEKLLEPYSIISIANPVVPLMVVVPKLL